MQNKIEEQNRGVDAIGLPQKRPESLGLTKQLARIVLFVRDAAGSVADVLSGIHTLERDDKAYFGYRTLETFHEWRITQPVQFTQFMVGLKQFDSGYAIFLEAKLAEYAQFVRPEDVHAGNRWALAQSDKADSRAQS